MRLLAALLIFLASPLLAVGPPGPMPWSCASVHGCDRDGICDEIVGEPIYFRFSETMGHNRYLIEEFRGSIFYGAIFENPKQAKRFMRKVNVDDEVALFFIQSNEISDAHGFRLHGTISNDSGKRSISDEYLLVGCNTKR